MREDQGERPAQEKSTCSIEIGDLQGDLHAHSNWDDE